MDRILLRQIQGMCFDHVRSHHLSHHHCPIRCFRRDYYRHFSDAAQSGLWGCDRHAIGLEDRSRALEIGPMSRWELGEDMA